MLRLHAISLRTYDSTLSEGRILSSDLLTESAVVVLKRVII